MDLIIIKVRSRQTRCLATFAQPRCDGETNRVTHWFFWLVSARKGKHRLMLYVLDTTTTFMFNSVSQGFAYIWNKAPSACTSGYFCPTTLLWLPHRLYYSCYTTITYIICTMEGAGSAPSVWCVFHTLLGTLIRIRIVNLLLVFRWLLHVAF